MTTLPTPQPTLAFGNPAFGVLDWAVLLGYFAMLLATGVWFARKEQSGTEDYFLGGRRMPTWAVAVSVLATSLSAATFVGGPQQAYTGDLTYLISNIGMVLAAVVVAAFFVPVFYRARVATVYELLEHRHGPGAKQAASWTFMLGRIMASGARIYIGALPMALILFEGVGGASETWHIVAAIWVMTVVGIIYTFVGGIASVIWTDVIQTAVFVGAAIAAIVLLLAKIDAPIGDVIETLRAAETPAGESKLTLLSTSTDPAANYTIFTAIFAFTLMGIASYGTDQDLVQRMLTCKSAAKGSASVLGAIVASVPVVSLFMVVGLLLWIFYQQPALVGEGAPDYEANDSRTVFLEFILREMPAGMTGLMMAGLFAAGLSSLNSGLNSMASTLMNDVYKGVAPAKSEKHYLRVGRLFVVGWGIVLGGFATFCVYWQSADGSTLIDFALGVMTFAYAGLLGVYLTTLFTKRGSTASVLAALITGFVVVGMLQPNVVTWWTGIVGLAEFELGFPWRLTAGAVAATCVCLIGNAKQTGARND